MFFIMRNIYLLIPLLIILNVRSKYKNNKIELVHVILTPYFIYPFLYVFSFYSSGLGYTLSNIFSLIMIAYLLLSVMFTIAGIKQLNKNTNFTDKERKAHVTISIISLIFLTIFPYLIGIVGIIFYL